MQNSEKEALLNNIERFNTNYPIGSEIVLQISKTDLLVTTVREPASLVFTTWPCLKTNHKEDYTWLARVVEFTDLYPRIKEKRVAYYGY